MAGGFQNSSWKGLSQEEGELSKKRETLNHIEKKKSATVPPFRFVFGREGEKRGRRGKGVFWDAIP